MKGCKRHVVGERRWTAIDGYLPPMTCRKVSGLKVLATVIRHWPWLRHVFSMAPMQGQVDDQRGFYALSLQKQKWRLNRDEQ